MGHGVSRLTRTPLPTIMAAVVLCTASTPSAARAATGAFSGSETMAANDRSGSLGLILDGAPVALAPTVRRQDGDVWVPLEAFCAVAGAVVKDIDGQLAVCAADGGDICVLIGAADQRQLDGALYGRLEVFAEPLGLAWSVTDDGVLAIARGAGLAATGVGVGDRPPRFELPDVVTGQLVSADVYYDRPAVFYMWASW